jgi:hypothetical protein
MLQWHFAVKATTIADLYPQRHQVKTNMQDVIQSAGEAGTPIFAHMVNRRGLARIDILPFDRPFAGSASTSS